VVWTLGQAAEEHDAAGTLLGYVGVITDVTAEHRAQEALRHANSELELRVHERTAELQQMALIVENSDDAIISADYEGIIRSWNPAAETMFGYSAEEMIGRESTAILTPAERLDESRELKRRVRAGETISHHETVRVSRTGELIEVAISLNPLRGAAGQIYGTFAVVRDITERKKAERSLQQLSGRLLRLQDEERRRVARELHDSTSQTLAGLSLNLAVLNRGFDTMPAPRRAEILADSLGLAESAARDLRTHAYLLHPPLLDERGLAAAVRWFVEGFSARSNIAVQLKISPRFPRLAEQIETTIFRVVQESLTNVHRHAQSATATIRLAARGGWITLEIRDRGRGLPAESQEELGVGIAGMKERLRQLRGTLTIQSSRRGTVVRARLPR
jgi:PAS domain S-box-containing protein